MTVKVLCKSSVSRDLKTIGPSDIERVLRQINEILGENPKSGEPLRGEFGGLLKFRVGDYRVIYALVGQDVVVLRIRHRSKVYEK